MCNSETFFCYCAFLIVRQLNMILENLNRQKLTNADWQRTVSISDAGVSPRIRKLPADEVSSLIANGALATMEYLGRQ